MVTIRYNKLVRDKIPEIIEAVGQHCTVEILSNEDYLRMVDAKLDEELAEYHKIRTSKNWLIYLIMQLPKHVDTP